eukprot:TRINITY_DN37728_c0_g1_i1.p1 TRINITY_DN37728_c0_g1~~TRINITY_DN37728_c0_g1_i1.p1  ORF type:complete len:466 (-),score=71.81 TRINITY_DN37728_c0_g1_i1:288-1685(-)
MAGMNFLKSRSPAKSIVSGLTGQRRSRERCLAGFGFRSGRLLSVVFAVLASSSSLSFLSSRGQDAKSGRAGSSDVRRREALEGAAAALTGGAAAASPLVVAAPASLALTSDERRMANLFEAVTPGVVSISKYPPSASLGEAGRSSGSGFVWDGKHIVTNFHVVNGMQKPYVTFLSKAKDQGSTPKPAGFAAKQVRTTIPTEVLGSDAQSDVAVLRLMNTTWDNEPIPKDLVKLLPRGCSSDLVVGQDVLAFGNPFGLEHSLSRGIISGVRRTMEGSGGRPINGVIQTDASINPGNSGGPLLNSDGQVIGVNTAILTGSGTFAGVGLAIPIDLVKNNVESIFAKGFVRRPFLGITFAPDSMSEELQLNGIMVIKVVPDGPAGKAGIRPVRAGRLGDVVVSIDGGRVRTSDDLFKVLDKRAPGDTIILNVQRASSDPASDIYESQNVTVTLGETGQKKEEVPAPADD